MSDVNVIELMQELLPIITKHFPKVVFAFTDDGLSVGGSADTQGIHISVWNLKKAMEDRDNPNRRVTVQILRNNGLSQEDIARFMKMSQAQISRYLASVRREGTEFSLF